MTSPSHILQRYLSVGQVLCERYELQSLIGAGAYGAIYSATDRLTQERVAVKALPPEMENTSKTALGRFARELKVVQNLHHPHVITLYDFGQTAQGVPFMVIEFVEGSTLESLVRHSPMQPEDGVDVLEQMLRGLGAAHDLGVVHRDLKPANIMIAGAPGRYVVKILDFGMAKLLERVGDTSIASLTREGVAVGTPRYIAPEQARGLKIGPYTDLYAVGLLAYEIFTGERVVKERSVDGAVLMHVSADPLPLPEIEQVPRDVRPILRRLLEKDLSQRYASASQVLVDLHEAMRLRRMRSSGGAPQFMDLRNASSAKAPLELDMERVAQASKEAAPAPSTRVRAPRRGSARLGALAPGRFPDRVP